MGWSETHQGHPPVAIGISCCTGTPLVSYCQVVSRTVVANMSFLFRPSSGRRCRAAGAVNESGERCQLDTSQMKASSGADGRLVRRGRNRAVRVQP